MPTRRHFLRASLVAGVSFASIRRTVAAPESLAYHPTRDVPAKLFDGRRSYCHTRAGIVANAGLAGRPRVVLTMNTIDLSGSDVFQEMYGLATDDLGKTWSGPVKIESLSAQMRTIEGEERPTAPGDFWPRWHAASKTLLGTGHSFFYSPDWSLPETRPRHTVYAAYDPGSTQWGDWRILEMPRDDKFFNSGAGCTQRFDLPDGEILLPIYFRAQKDKCTKVTVLRCSFDGKTLRYEGHGDEIGVADRTRGVAEPSLTRFADRFYLTIRHDDRAYVTRGKDGLAFEPLRAWTFDDGSDLGSYNTQAHWVTHSEGLFLVYTRKGANNDHVFRHRAPLFMAQVDPERLCVLRSTEQILVPQRGARLGNFGVTSVTPDETWVTVAEWMQPKGVEQYGSDGSVWVARIRWDRPNASTM